MSASDVPWQTLIDTAPDGLCVLDADGTVRYANAAAQTLLGLPAPDGMPLIEWLADLGALKRDLLLRTIETGGQLRLHLTNGEHPHLLFDAAPLPGGKGTLGRVRRDYEAEASQVVALMVHDLRKPMTAIMGYAKMLLTIGAESLSDMQRQFLDTINRNVERLDDNLSAVQDMSRLDRAMLKLALAAQSPAEVAARVLDELNPLVEAQGHHVTLDFPGDLPYVHADAERLQQIFHILLDNALKYTPPGGHIKVQGRATGAWLQIDIIDSGIGIPTAEQEKLFTKFFRGEDELVNEHAGLGLNLYIARELLQLHAGQLWFESCPGQGSTFSFTLPVGGAV